jgi:hypothetical protein
MVRRTGLIVALIMTLIGFATFPSMAQSGRTFYISSSSGSNSNVGTSTGAPWKSAPYMPTGSGCSGSGSGPSYTHQAGDKFVFKGGDTWGAACFDWIIQAGGTASAQDYYGVCLSSDADSPCSGGTSWPSSGWTRPQFNLGGSQPGSQSIGPKLISTSGAYSFGAGLPYITFDNFEISNWDTGLNSFSNQDNQTGSAFVLGGDVNNPAAGTIVENMYIHDWFTNENYISHAPSSYQPIAYGVLHGAYIARNNTISDANGHYTYNGVTMNRGTMGGCAGCTYFYGNTVSYGWMGCSSVYSCHDNEFHDIYNFQTNTGADDPNAIHSHVIYEDGANQTAVYAYNNLIHDTNAGITIGQFFYYSYIFNNVLWNNTHANGIYLTACEPGFGCSDNSSHVGYVANNTIDQTSQPSSTASGCFGWYSTAGQGTLNFYNNICLPNASSGVGGFSAATLNQAHNPSMGAPEAVTYGFTAANKYRPTSSDPSISGQGVNLTSSCSGNLAPLCKDTSGAPWFGGSYVARQTPWDLGAFVGGGASSSSSTPNPPTNLTATVQ